jgi:hypothetical protein
VLLVGESAWAKYLSIRVLATNFDAKLEEFAMDPGSASERIRQGHFTDHVNGGDKLCQMAARKCTSRAAAGVAVEQGSLVERIFAERL